MAKKKQQKIKPARGWAGISDGKLHCWHTSPQYYEIYPSRKLARDHYEVVVPVLIKPLKQPRE